MKIKSYKFYTEISLADAKYKFIKIIVTDFDFNPLSPPKKKEEEE